MTYLIERLDDEVSPEKEAEFTQLVLANYMLPKDDGTTRYIHFEDGKWNVMDSGEGTSHWFHVSGPHVSFDAARDAAVGSTDNFAIREFEDCLLYTSPSPRDRG